MVQVQLKEGKVELHMMGMDKLWALKSKLVIPRDHIVDIRMDEEIAKTWWHGLKLPGSNIPGLLTAGTFYQNGAWSFWCVHRPQVSIVITLKNEFYSRVIIEVENPKAVVEEVSAMI